MSILSKFSKDQILAPETLEQFFGPKLHCRLRDFKKHNLQKWALFRSWIHQSKEMIKEKIMENVKELSQKTKR